jgi:hypothetical protein
MILGVSIARGLPGESYALFPDAVKNHTADIQSSQLALALVNA